MMAKEIMAIINRMVARRDRQQAALNTTLTELLHWETELERLRKTPPK